MKKKLWVAAAAATLTATVGLWFALSPAPEEAIPHSMHVQGSHRGAEPAHLAKLPLNLVCMVNNRYMGKEQIPVSVNGKTYYGCCEMCKKTLAEKPESRVARDPLSGAEVDKALAVIAMLPQGDVLYFESEDTWNRYRKKAGL